MQNWGLTDYLALWGAVLATILGAKDLLAYYHSRQKEKRQVRVESSYDILPESNPISGTTQVTFLVISAINTGQRQVQIQEAGLRTLRGDIGLHSRSLPKVLTDGERIDLSFNLNKVQRRGREALVTNFFVKDSEGSLYEGELPEHPEGLLA